MRDQCAVAQLAAGASAVVSRIHGIELSLKVWTSHRSSTKLGIGTAPLLQIPVAVLLIVAEAVPGLIALLNAQAQPLRLPRRQQRIDHLPLYILPQSTCSWSRVFLFQISITFRLCCTRFTLSLLLVCAWLSHSLNHQLLLDISLIPPLLVRHVCSHYCALNTSLLFSCIVTVLPWAGAG